MATYAELLGASEDPTLNHKIKVGCFIAANVVQGTWPTMFSAGTAGSEGPCTCTGSTASNVRDSVMRPVGYFTVDAVTNRLASFGQLGIAQLFGSSMASHFAVYSAQDTGATSASSGNVYYNPIISQYT